MNNITLKSPAKINLSLDITEKNSQGYHILNMIVQTIDIYDYITFSKNNSKQINIYSRGLDIPLSEDNIIYKAVTEFFQKSNIHFSGININISKNIPIQAGLGGGSSNAASALFALNRLFGFPLSLDKLKEIGLTLGADVPLFFFGGTCLCQGIGEIITKLPDLPLVYFVIIKPDFGFSTSEIYKSYDNIEVSKHPDTHKIISAISKSDIKQMAENIYNVLEEAVTNKEIFNIKSALINYGAIASNMTGSGSCVFGIFDDKNLAQKSINKLKNIYPNIFLSTPVNFDIMKGSVV